MLCEVCKGEEATVHLTQIISGKMQKIDLCEKCAKEKGVADPAGFSLADMLLGLGAADEIKTGSSRELVCPVCGFTQPDFKKTGRLGCPQCYTTFSEGLEVILKDMHKGTQHKGKIPNRIAKQQIYATRLKDLQTLQTELQSAVLGEKYEEAASIRDQIATIENELKS
jgi:protein arginine kinase activator